ncbi:MAG: teichoic acid D-Ala incorporation-associated protein DltX [Terrimicrobiaceae bacterium]|nr:teichoic acid D-Ala incorporation-associated protein DltX [Terrimicrobiaceae bacterium]
MTNSLPPWIRFALLALYYLFVILALFLIYSSGSFKTPEFIYQGF